MIPKEMVSKLANIFGQWFMHGGNIDPPYPHEEMKECAEMPNGIVVYNKPHAIQYKNDGYVYYATMDFRLEITRSKHD